MGGAPGRALGRGLSLRWRGVRTQDAGAGAGGLLFSFVVLVLGVCVEVACDFQLPRSEERGSRRGEIHGGGFFSYLIKNCSLTSRPNLLIYNPQWISI